MYRFSSMPIKKTNGPVHRTKNINHIYMKLKGLNIAREILKGEKEAGDITISNIKIYYKAIVIKQHGWHKNRLRLMRQNRKSRLKNKFSHLQTTDLKKSVPTTHIRKSLFKKWFWGLGI